MHRAFMDLELWSRHNIIIFIFPGKSDVSTEPVIPLFKDFY